MAGSLSSAWSCLCFCLLLACAESLYIPHGRGVRLADVQAITLYRGKKTTSRRAGAVPQLHCVGGCEYEPDAVQCINVGMDGVDVQWRCEADLPRDVKFAHTQVTCEGFKYPEDELVLEGSCGLEYSLKRAGGGGSWFQKKSQGGAYYGGGSSRISEPPSNSWHAGQWIMLLLVLYIGYYLQRVYRQGTFRPAPSRQSSSDYRPSAPPSPPGGFFSGGGLGPSNSCGSGWGGSSGPSKGSTSTAGSGAGSSWGSWSSAAAGYGLGYLMGTRRRSPQQSSFWGAQPTRPQGGSSWFSRSSETSRSSEARSRGAGMGSRGAETSRATGYASTSRR